MSTIDDIIPVSIKVFSKTVQTIFENTLVSIALILMFFNSDYFFVYLAKCKGGCRNGGTCIDPDTCHCQPGFQGTNCRQGK